jgi:hypothetical protein
LPGECGVEQLERRHPVEARRERVDRGPNLELAPQLDALGDVAEASDALSLAPSCR